MLAIGINDIKYKNRNEVKCGEKAHWEETRELRSSQASRQLFIFSLGLQGPPGFNAGTLLL